MKKIYLSVGVSVAVSMLVYGDGEVTFNGVFGTKEGYVGTELTQSLMINASGTVTKYGVPDSALTDAAHWSDGGEVSPEKDYVIAGANGRVATFTGDTVFNGNSLTLGAEGVGKGYLVPVKAAALTVGGEGLVINDGGVVWNSSYKSATRFDGKLTVNTPKSNPADFWDHWSGGQTHVMNFTTLTGDSATGIRIRGQSHTNTEEYKNRLEFSGDWRGFYGLMTVAMYYDKVTLDGIDCPGEFDYSEGSVLALAAGGDDYTGSFRFGSMKLKSTVAVTLGVSATTNATFSTESLTVAGDGKMPLSVVMSGVPRTQWPLDLESGPRKITLVDLPATAAPIAETFDPAFTVPSSWSDDEKKYARYRSLVAADMKEEIEDGRRRLVCEIPKFTYCDAQGDIKNLLLDHPEYWQGVESGEGFSPDTAYFVTHRSTVALTQGKEVVFGGGPLCLMQGYISTGGKMTFSDLRIVPPARLQYASSHGVHEFNGNITVYDRNIDGNAASIQLWSGQNETMTVNSNVRGKGRIYVDSPTWSPEEKQADRTVVFTGDNSGYAGKIVVANYADGYATVLRISGDTALGGALDGFVYDAVNLKNRSVLEVASTSALDESTRGIFAENGSSIRVVNEGDVFSVGSTLTCTGTVTKTGSGVLSVSRVVGSGAGDAGLSVAAGALAVSASDAFDGVDIEFAEGASFRFDADTSDADMAATGLDLGACTITRAGGRLDVTCVTAEDVAGITKKSLALFTGGQAEIEALAEGLRVKLLGADGAVRRGFLEFRDASEAGEKTVVASFDVRGTVVIVK